MGMAVCLLVIGIGVPLVRYSMYRRSMVGQTSPVEQEGMEFILFTTEEMNETLDSIEWGNISVGETVSRPFTLQVIENNSTFSLYTSEWQPPEAENYLTLTWDYDNKTLMQGDVLSVNFFLSVSSTLTEDSGITDFSFTITIVCNSDSTEQKD